MESVHYTRSKSRRTSLVSDTPSDVEPDAAAPETAISGPVRRKVASYGCGGAGVHIAAAS